MKEENKLLNLLAAMGTTADCTDKEAWEKWKLELAAVTDRMPVFKTMRYQAIQSIAKEKIDEIHALKANKSTKP